MLLVIYEKLECVCLPMFCVARPKLYKFEYVQRLPAQLRLNWTSLNMSMDPGPGPMCGGAELRLCTGGEARALFCRDPLCTDRQTQLKTLLRWWVVNILQTSSIQENRSASWTSTLWISAYEFLYGIGKNKCNNCKSNETELKIKNLIKSLSRCLHVILCQWGH